MYLCVFLQVVFCVLTSSSRFLRFAWFLCFWHLFCCPHWDAHVFVRLYLQELHWGWMVWALPLLWRGLRVPRGWGDRTRGKWFRYLFRTISNDINPWVDLPNYSAVLILVFFRDILSGWSLSRVPVYLGDTKAFLLNFQKLSISCRLELYTLFHMMPKWLVIFEVGWKKMILPISETSPWILPALFLCQNVEKVLFFWSVTSKRDINNDKCEVCELAGNSS